MILTRIGRTCGFRVAADDYTRRRIGLTEHCASGFLRIDFEGKRKGIFAVFRIVNTEIESK